MVENYYLRSTASSLMSILRRMACNLNSSVISTPANYDSDYYYLLNGYLHNISAIFLCAISRRCGSQSSLYDPIVRSRVKRKKEIRYILFRSSSLETEVGVSQVVDPTVGIELASRLSYFSHFRRHRCCGVIVVII